MPGGPIYEFESGGETETIITEDEAERFDDEDEEPTYRVEALAGRFRFDHTESDARRGEMLRPTQSGTITPNGRPIVAYVDRMPSSGNAELLVRSRRGSEFQFDPSPPSTVYSATDRADGEDLPVATEDSDEYHTYIQFGNNTTTNIDGYEEYRFEMTPPGRASEVTIHTDTLPAFPTGTNIWIHIRFGHGHEDGTGDPITVTGSTPNGSYSNPDYHVEVDGTDDIIFVTTDVPSYEELQVVIQSDASGAAAEMNLNAMVK